MWVCYNLNLDNELLYFYQTLKIQILIPSCLKVLVDSLNKEENRLAMDLSQGRSIKFVRPTDESDVCEGGGFDLGLDRFQPVRSSVRENVLWSMVILCSKGSSILGSSLDITIEALKEVIPVNSQKVN